MEIAPEKQAIVDAVGTIFVKRLNMGSFEGGKRVFIRNRAGAMIGIRYQDPERSLAQPGRNRRPFAISGPFLFNTVCFSIQAENLLAFPRTLKVTPNELASLVFELVAFGLAPDDRRAPIRSGKPHRFVEEERLGQDNAPDLDVLVEIVGNSSVMDEALPHFGIGGGPVSLLEGLPGKAYGENRKGGEDSSPGDQIPVAGPRAAVKFEEEEIAFVERSEFRVRRRLPEVNLIDVRKTTQVIEPVMISNAGV